MMRHLEQSTYRRLRCIAIALLLIPLGLLCRFAPLGLPFLIVKYGGSFLWAAMIYWCVAFLCARQPPSVLAVIAAVCTTAIEFIKRIQSPDLDAFRDTLAGKVLLGRYFSYRDIAVYWAAILCCMWIDHSAIHTRSPSKK